MIEAPKLSRELAVAGYKQVEAATKKLNQEFYRDTPDPAVIIACMKQGALLELLPKHSWPTTLAKENMVEAMAAMLGDQPVYDQDLRRNVLDGLSLHGSEEMFAAVAPLVKHSTRDLFKALEMAVDKNNLDTARRLIQNGAPLYDPHPQEHERVRLGNFIPSTQMFDLLTEHGYAFDKSDLLRSALSNQGRYASSPQQHRAPRPDLLEHMLSHGTPIEDNSTPGMPFPVLLNQQDRAFLYKKEMAQCARILLEYGADLSLGYGTNIPALLVLSEAGVSADTLFDIADKAVEWRPLERGNAAENMKNARSLLLDLDSRGITLERLTQNTRCPPDWAKAFSLAGSEQEKLFNEDKLTPAERQEREAAKLQRATANVSLGRKAGPRL